MASGWQSQRQLFQDRLDVLHSLSPSLSTLVSQAKQTRKKEDIDKIRTRHTQYLALQTDITNYIASHSNDSDITSIIETITATKRRIRKLANANKELTVEVETAITRDELLRSRNTKRNAHTLFLMDRPLKKQMIPVLWLMSVLFIGIALIIIKDSMPVVDPLQTGASVLSGILAFISNKVVLYVILFCGLCLTVYLPLKITGVL